MEKVGLLTTVTKQNMFCNEQKVIFNFFFHEATTSANEFRNFTSRKEIVFNINVYYGKNIRKKITRKTIYIYVFDAFKPKI